MSNKQSKKNSSSKESHHNTKTAGARAARKQLAKRARATGDTHATSTGTAVARPDPRLPAVGTVIEKRDRHGQVRCKCKVEKNGIRYNGTVYRSLSGAAMAAATDLGLESPTQNGFLFWALN